MTSYLLKRGFASVVLFWLVTIVTFILIHQAPGGPAALARPGAGTQGLEQARKSLGLTGSIWDQYGSWAGRVFHADLGVSFDQGVSVGSLITDRLPNTLLLALAGLLVGTVVGVVLGVLGALRQGGVIDAFGRTFGILGVAVPQFWVGLILILLFSVRLGWLPAGDMHSPDGGGLLDLLRHLVLPAAVVALFVVANVLRFTRASVISVLHEPYLVTARAKGVRPRRVLWIHVLRNALLPIITIIGFSIPLVVGGAAITEVVFSWPGIGNLAVTAAQHSDYPVLMGVTLVLAALVIVVNLLTDLSYRMVDPRVRIGMGADR
jgi:peptide/nickel transport system permease protein